MYCVPYAHVGYLSETVLQLAQQTMQSFHEQLDMATNRRLLAPQKQMYDGLPLSKACRQLQMSHQTLPSGVKLKV